MLYLYLFIFGFFLVYFLLHLYPYLRVISPGISNKTIKIFIKFLFLFNFLGPLVVRYVDKNLPPQITFIISFLALWGMGFILYLVFFTLILEFYRIFTKIYKKSPFSNPKHFLIITLFFSFSFSFYSHYETYQLEIIKIKIPTSKLPPHLSSFKILHFSDLHLGPIIGLRQINMIKKVYFQEKPDLILSTGDLVDGNMKNRLHLAEAFNEINPTYGKFAVVGNHEYYRDIIQAVEFMKKTGFKILRGETISIENWLTLIGLEDEDCKFFNACKGSLNEIELLKKAPPFHFKILLKHKPKVIPQTIGHFDLMLSGHTHGGLYYPIGYWIVTKFFKFKHGFEYLGKGSYIIVSKGVGTGLAPMRFLTPPDVIIIELIRTF